MFSDVSFGISKHEFDIDIFGAYKAKVGAKVDLDLNADQRSSFTLFIEELGQAAEDGDLAVDGHGAFRLPDRDRAASLDAVVTDVGGVRREMEVGIVGAHRVQRPAVTILAPEIHLE